jgi:hypothetical protein
MNFFEEQKRRVEENLFKSYAETELMKALEGEELSKGKRANLGEVREWGGKKYQKTTQGWVPAGKPNKEEKKSTFEQVLSDPEGRSIIEGIEGLDSKRTDHKPLYEDYKKQLKDKFGYDYRDSDWDNLKDHELKHNLKEAQSVYVEGESQSHRVVEIKGNMVRLSGKRDAVHIAKLQDSNRQSIVKD